ncbi:unnamed protein product [Effrenium voratum]|nr:unnamed protein product [Effrenium voratum]
MGVLLHLPRDADFDLGLVMNFNNADAYPKIMRTKVGVWDWEEHVYIFTAVTAPNLSSTVSLAELHSALASVPRCMNWKYPLFLRHASLRFFRLCDFDAKEKMTRSKFLSVMEVVKPSLRLEHVRSKLRCHYSKMLGKIRGVNRQAALEQLVPLIFANFMQHLEQPTRRRSRVPEDYQRMFDELVLTHEDMTLLLQLLAPREQEPSSFWHMLKNFAPSVARGPGEILERSVQHVLGTRPCRGGSCNKRRP